MLGATLKSLWARKVRLLLSALSIVLGVAFVCGSLLFTNLLRSSFDQLVGGALGDVNVSAEAGGVVGFEGVNPDELPHLTPEQVAGIAEVDGVERAEGIVSSTQVFPLDKDDNLLSFPGAPGIGMNWHDALAVGGQVGARIVEGRAPEADDELVLDPATAERGGYTIGDQVRVSTPRDGIRSYRLVGTGTYGAGSTAGASYLFFTVTEAQAIVQGGADTFYAVWIQKTDGADAETVAAAVQAVLPEGFVAETGTELASTIQEQIDVGLGFINTFLLVFAGIALLIATLMILNTFSILVAQRAREIALLRAIGAVRSQIRASVLIEALIVGLIGATAGLLAGYGLAWAILAVLRVVGIDLGPVVPTMTWQAVVASYGIGIVVTLIAAYLPASRAARTRPVEAMVAAAQSGPEKQGVLPMVGIGLIEVGAAAMASAVWLPVPNPLVWFGVGTPLLLVGAVLATSVVGAPLVSLAGRIFHRLFGEVGRLAQLNAARQPRRTAATAATLMIGLTLVSTVAILAASTTASIGDRLAADQRGDFVISPVAYQPFDAELADQARDVDGVEDVYAFYSSSVRLPGKDEPVDITGATAEGLERGTSLDLIAGSLAADGDARPAVISSEFAATHNLGLGQLLDLESPKGTAQVLITGIHDGGTALPVGQVIVTPETYALIADTSMVSSLVVFTDGDPEAARFGLQDAVRQHPSVALADVDEYVDARVDQFGQIFAVIYALLALAIIISVLGIVNTLALSVMERTREVGLLRAVGLTRGQLRLMITLEAVIVATLGAVLGVVIGVVAGAALVSLLGDQGIDKLVIPGWQLLVFVVLAAICGVLAAIGPARRAVRQDTLRAIAAE